jgi:hypothetical protein
MKRQNNEWMWVDHPRYQQTTSCERTKQLYLRPRHLSPRKIRKASLRSDLARRLRLLPELCLIGAVAILIFGAGALAAVTSAGFLLPQETLSRIGMRQNMDSPAKEWSLNRALRIDDDVAEAPTR